MLVGLGAAELGHEAALAHDQDAVAHAQHLGQLAGDHEDAQALLGQLAHEPVDLGLGADVDAARGLVDDEQPGLAGQPLAHDDLLLVAAGELVDDLLAAGGDDVELVDHVLRRRAARLALSTMPKRVSEPRMAIEMFSRMRIARTSPCVPRSSGT